VLATWGNVGRLRANQVAVLASTTVLPDSRARLSAKDDVNLGGMCCTTRIGKSVRWRSAGSRVSRTLGPPVEAAMTNARTVRRGTAWSHCRRRLEEASGNGGATLAPVAGCTADARLRLSRN
jgi:hypothetical protein